MTGQLKGKALQTQPPCFVVARRRRAKTNQGGNCFGSVLAGQSSLRPTQGRGRRNVLGTIPSTNGGRLGVVYAVEDKEATDSVKFML